MTTKKLIPIHLPSLHHAEVGQFITRFFEDFAKSGLQPETDENFHQLFQTLNSKLPTYDKALAQIRQSEETKKLALLDKTRDADIQALRDSIKPYRNSKSEEKKQAYTAIKIVLDEYKNITQESYEEETKKINTLLSILKEEAYQKHISVLKIEDFITEVEESNKAFNDAFALRSVQTLQKETYNTKALRKEITDLYRKLVNYTLTMADIKQGEFFPKALEVINNSRKYYADIIARR